MADTSLHLWYVGQDFLLPHKGSKLYQHQEYFGFIVVLGLPVSYFASAYPGQSIKLKMLVERISEDGIFNLLYPDKTALRGIKQNSLDGFQLCFDFG